MITGIGINNAPIGSNLTVQLAPVILGESSHNSNRSDPITIGMDIYAVSKCDQAWENQSRLHIKILFFQFNN